jgi:hypothetical protein
MGNMVMLSLMQLLVELGAGACSTPPAVFCKPYTAQPGAGPAGQAAMNHLCAVRSSLTGPGRAPKYH